MEKSFPGRGDRINKGLRPGTSWEATAESRIDMNVAYMGKQPWRVKKGKYQEVLKVESTGCDDGAYLKGEK
jgi:hypothetical protein